MVTAYPGLDSSPNDPLVVEIQMESGDTFLVNSKKGDSISKLKARIFIEKDIEIERQTIVIENTFHPDSETLDEIGYEGPQQSVKLVVAAPG